ncbi:MAG: hypothetical protein ACXV2I_06980 [Actinomycetes bacterium]
MAVLLAAAVTGCGTGHGTVTTRSDNGCPPANAEGNAQIDYVAFVKVGGLTFQATLSPEVTVPASRLGPTVLTVRCTISDIVHNPGFQPRDGDAAFLPIGTELRAVTGYRRDFRLAAHEDGVWRVYEVTDVPRAVTGSDQLDLAGKVVRIHLVEGERGKDIRRTVDNPARVAALVRALLAAPVLPDRAQLQDELATESPVFIRFDLADGTAVQRAWYVEAGVLWPRIQAPPELAMELAPDAP